ncbi:hypothetical protein AVEN_108316-1 [Araneus ventricosus]|uniref:Uncharacterized protein n=1 Tax=Araneus ventricosus TaxID=182803 RepID=A0A4Y2M5Q1_ARAVE|nr:hypothetical protein AVEN_108316-1 [Araneus ventricosus]
METVHLGRYHSVFMDLKTFMPKFVKKLNKGGLLKDLTILKESIDYKEYEMYFRFMVIPLIFMQYLKLKKVVPESLEAARWQDKMGAGSKPAGGRRERLVVFNFTKVSI